MLENLKSLANIYNISHVWPKDEKRKTDFCNRQQNILMYYIQNMTDHLENLENEADDEALEDGTDEEPICL